MRKRKLLLLLCMVFVTVVNHAQELHSPLRFGIKAGGNLSKLSIDNGAQDVASFKMGYYGGGLMEISPQIGSKFKLQFEALYSRNNFKNVLTDPAFYTAVAKTNLSQLSIPVLAKYFVVPSVSINVGMSANFNLKGKSEVELSEPNSPFGPFNSRIECQTFQLGTLAGITCYLHKGLFVDGRYNYYLDKLVDSPGEEGADFKNMSTFQLGIGYKF